MTPDDTLVSMADHLLDIGSFQRWALGDLVDNANRGIFAEWLVGQALGVLAEGEARAEWTAFDLRYGDTKVEVKASGLSQTWNPHRQSKPSFNIAPRTSAWDAATDEWASFDPPQRPADVYVLCLHEPIPATNENVRDPACWKFWVIATQVLNRELGPQAGVGLTTLNRLATSVGWSGLQAEVDRCVRA